MTNKPLLKQTLDHIKANPESWDQSRWFCGTAACFAGHACLLSGDLAIETEDWSYAKAAPTTGGEFHVHDRAVHLLGITESQGDTLFYQDNHMEDLERMVDNLLNDRHIIHGFSDDEKDRLCWDEYEDEEDDGYDEGDE